MEQIKVGATVLYVAEYMHRATGSARVEREQLVFQGTIQRILEKEISVHRKDPEGRLRVNYFKFTDLGKKWWFYSMEPKKEADELWCSEAAQCAVRDLKQEEPVLEKLRICLEIQDVKKDSDGNLTPMGIDITFGEVPKEGFEEKYQKLIESVNIKSLLELLYLETEFEVESCRIITPEEYDLKYGKDPEDTQ